MAAKNSSDVPTRHGSRLATVIENNIHIIASNNEASARKRTAQQKIADSVTHFSGRMVFVYFHIIWFGVWILFNLGLVGSEPFDPFPFSLLTMIVSLEAIFISAFVLISQNRFSVEADRRADLDLHIGLLAEHELTRALKMLDAIQDKLGIDNHMDGDLRELEEDVHPEDVLIEIELIQQKLKEDKI